MQENNTSRICRICDSKRVSLVKESNISKLTSDSFAITDSHYGVTGALYACADCGFVQCYGLEDTTHFYEGLEDVSYEDTREARLLQSHKIIERIKPYVASGSLHDIGAGSGILVEAATAAGYTATGVEPSRWLAAQAEKRGLPVRLGIFPGAEQRESYDVITIIDVIEHVDDPRKMLVDAYAYLKKGGLLVVVTPDLGSLFARTLSWRWWHFRIAHIGYFNQKNLCLAATRAGFTVLKMRRASWYFTLAYLLERIGKYLPRWLRFRVPGFFKKIIVPLNLGDSMMLIAKKL